MSLEQKLDEMTGALKDNTAAVRALLAAGGGKAPAATTAAKDAAKDTKKAADKKAIPFETMKAAVMKVRDEKGKPVAQKIIKDVGKAAALAEIKEDLFAAVIAASEKALEPESDDSAEDTAADDDGL